MELTTDARAAEGCPGPDVLTAYVLGKLAPGRVEEVARHISRCPSCESSLHELPLQEDSLVASLRRWAPGLTDAQAPADSRDASAGAGEPTASEEAPPLEGSDPALPAPFGKFRLQARIGRGGMGVVYRALDTRLGRPVALKRIRDGLLAGPEARARFRSEVEAAARLEHPHIVRLYEYGEQAGEPYCAMELLAGGLDRRLADGPLPEREAAGLVATLAGAVAFAHGKGVVHRDLKPANVLLATDGTPKVGDFGMAKLLDADSGQTQTDAVLGTASYMAPEQARGQSRAAGPAADVYGLGAILYETLTGQPPFRGAGRLETLELVRTREPTPPGRLRPGLSPALEAVCLKCLHKEPGGRYGSAQALADDLRRWLKDEPTEARPPGPAARAWHFVRRRPALLAVLLLAVFAAAAFWFLNPDRPAKDIEARLARGEAVTLIGETGRPAWQRWRLGGDKAQTSLAADGTFSIHTWDMTLLELVRDPQQRNFRLRAQVRHEKSDALGRVGLYVCHEQLAVGPSGLHSFLGLSFDDVNDATKVRDLLPPDLPGPRPPPPRGNRATQFARHYARLESEPNWSQPLDGCQGPPFQPAVLARKEWRTLTVEVRGDRVRSYWGDELALVGEMEIGPLAARAQKAFQKFGDARGVGPVAAKRDWFPVRGGLGLYVYKGSASFRRVMIEPLTD